MIALVMVCYRLSSLRALKINGVAEKITAVLAPYYITKSACEPFQEAKESVICSTHLVYEIENRHFISSQRGYFLRDHLKGATQQPPVPQHVVVMVTWYILLLSACTFRLYASVLWAYDCPYIKFHVATCTIIGQKHIQKKILVASAKIVQSARKSEHVILAESAVP